MSTVSQNMTLYSDLHLEMYSSMPQLPLRDRRDLVVVIAGDLHPAKDREKFARALEYVAGAAAAVIFVPGNHEYYCIPPGSSVGMLDASMMSSCREVAASRIHFLNTQHADVGNVRFIGATLWTDTPEYLSSRAADLMRDYTRIWSAPNVLVTPQDIVSLHRTHVDYLWRAAREAERFSQNEVVVVTHHVPDIALQKRNLHGVDPSVARFYYCTDTRPIWQYRDSIVAWMCGHDHTSRFEQLSVNSPLFVSNAAGYPGQLNEEFDSQAIYTL